MGAIKHKHLRGINLIKTLKNHFFKFVIIPLSDSECMEWQGYINPRGYGKLMHDLKSYRAHRIAYLIWKGNIPQNKEVCHTCDNTKCINPNHLFLGTHSENMQDMADKKRNPTLLLKGSEKPKSKLNEVKIRSIKRLLAKKWKQRDIAKRFGVHQTVIKSINLNRTWRHVV